MITRDTIDIHKLVEDIHSAESAQRGGKWADFCKPRGLGHTIGGRFWPTDYAKFVTGLYTLRAWLRGKHHRKNAPEEIRDFNRSMVQSGRERLCQTWDEKEHNREVAEHAAERYMIEATAKAG